MYERVIRSNRQEIESTSLWSAVDLVINGIYDVHAVPIFLRESSDGRNRLVCIRNTLKERIPYNDITNASGAVIVYTDSKR